MTLEKKIGTVILAVLVACAVAHGQQKDPRVNPPIAPLPPLPLGESRSTVGTAPGPAAAPTKSEQQLVSEVEQLSLGLGGGRSVLTSGFRISFHGDTNASANSGASKLSSLVSFGGNVALTRNWARSAFSLDYSAGGTLYNTRSNLNRQSQVIGLRYSLAGRSWSLTLRDNFSLLPESAFGFGAGTGNTLLPGLPGQVQSQLNPLLVPNQSILTGVGRRISNTFAGQVAYTLSRRSSLSLSSSYGFLRSMGSGLINGDQWSVGGSYSYLVTGKDSMSLSYSHSGQGFGSTQFGISGDTLSAGYSRQLTGRLALHIGGGPQISRFRDRIAGNGTSVSISMRSSLQYQLSEVRLNLSYFRGITGGSGVLQGAHTDQVDGGVSKQLSRLWRASLGLGYARNVSLIQSTGLTNQLTFNSWHTDFSLSRPVGRHTRMGIRYGLNGQRSNSSLCVSAVCGRSSVRHVFGLSFDFGLPPIALE